MPLRLTRRGDTPHWYLHGTVGRRRVRESTGTAEKAAADRIRIRRETEILDRHIHGPKSVATFPEALNLYLDQGGEGRFAARLLTHFATTRLAAIDQAAIAAAARRLYPDAAPATVNRQLITPLSAIMNVAADHGLCDPPRFKRRRVRPPQRRAVPPEWLAAVMAQAAPHLAALLAFMAFSGARISEAVRLTWADIDLAAGDAVLHCTKTQPRRVALPPTVVAAIASIPGPRRPAAPVFRYSHRSSPIDALATACRRADVPVHSFHEIGRHTFATWMLQQGETLADVADAGGWKSIALVKDIYGHLEHSRTDRAVRNLDRRLTQSGHTDETEQPEPVEKKR
ncbi:MAG: tyrosine-type recombinase/integrase [Minwuia sp.]|nr:tyrosine-type recombinase/integrase [Minwuia sp.]